MRKLVWIAGLVLVFIVGCQLVPSTGNTANDAAAAQSFVPPEIPGYTSTDATSVTDALTKAGASVSLVTGNVALAGAIAKLDNMISCYKSVGAVAARVYTEQNIPTTGIPKIGALAVVNTTRIQNNFVQCAVNIINGPSAQAANVIQPCGSSGQKVVNGENLTYVYAATTPELCQIFQQPFN